MAIQNTVVNPFANLLPAAGAASAAPADKPKSQFWLNVGLDASGAGMEGYDFLSLALGIPLDGMEMLPTNSKNQQFAQFQQARNALYEQLMELAKGLKPGEATIVPLQVQVRRVGNDNPAPDAGSNPFMALLSPKK